MAEKKKGGKAEKKKCENATSNPDCPYIVQIQQCTEDITLIKRALIGDLANRSPGLIQDVREFRSAVAASISARWRAKDYGTVLLGIAALITAIVASVR